MSNRMTKERLFAAEKEGKAARIKSWHGKETSDILFRYGKTLYHTHSTIFQGDGISVSKLSTQNEADIEKNFSNVQEFEDFKFFGGTNNGRI